MKLLKETGTVVLKQEWSCFHLLKVNVTAQKIHKNHYPDHFIRRFLTSQHCVSSDWLFCDTLSDLLDSGSYITVFRYSRRGGGRKRKLLLTFTVHAFMKFWFSVHYFNSFIEYQHKHFGQDTDLQSLISTLLIMWLLKPTGCTRWFRIVTLKDTKWYKVEL